jgi:hypothetical protein
MSAMIGYQLKPPVEAFGWQMETLEDAAYVVRRYAIETDDSAARKLVRFMRDAQTIEEAGVAESRLRAWAMATMKAVGRTRLAEKIGPGSEPAHASGSRDATGMQSASDRSPGGMQN